jgi:hypothetical protein
MDGSSQISENLACLSVFRDCQSAGVMDYKAQMPYIDFMLDMIGSSKLLSEPATAHAWVQSLSSDDKVLVRKKISLLIEEKKKRESEEYDLRNNPFLSTEGPKMVFSPKKELEVKPDPEFLSEKLEGALCGLGFKRQSVSKFVKSLNKDSMSIPLPDLVRRGVQVLNGNV